MVHGTRKPRECNFMNFAGTLYALLMPCLVESSRGGIVVALKSRPTWPCGGPLLNPSLNGGHPPRSFRPFRVAEHGTPDHCESGTRCVSVGSKNGIRRHQRCRTAFKVDARTKPVFAQGDEGKFLAQENSLVRLLLRRRKRRNSGRPTLAWKILPLTKVLASLAGRLPDADGMTEPGESEHP